MNEELYYGTDETGAVVVHIPVSKLKDAPRIVYGFTSEKTIVDCYITIPNQPIKELLADLKKGSKTHREVAKFFKR